MSMLRDRLKDQVNQETRMIKQLIDQVVSSNENNIGRLKDARQRAVNIEELQAAIKLMESV